MKSMHLLSNASDSNPSNISFKRVHKVQLDLFTLHIFTTINFGKIVKTEG